MPSIAGNNLSPLKENPAFISETVRSNTGDVTPQKRRLRSNSTVVQENQISTPPKWRSPRHCENSSPNSPLKRVKIDFVENPARSQKSPAKKVLSFPVKQNWNPRNVEQMSAVKEALHVSRAPSTVVCREDEQRRIFEFCKTCVEQEKAGSLYICGCPGTGKSLSMDKVKQQVVDWAKGADLQPPDVLAITCTSLTNTSEIFSKILGENQPRKKINSSTSPLQHLQKLYSQKQQLSGPKMMLIIADELDYLISKDQAVLHDLFMLTTFPFSRCILIGTLFVTTLSCRISGSNIFWVLKLMQMHKCVLILVYSFAGIANAIDLADRFVPRLKALNCKPLIVTFRAYSKDQIVRILQERLMALPYIVFQPQTLELCARKVAAVSGDLRKALSICRSAIEMLEAELRETASNMNSLSAEKGFFDDQQMALAPESLKLQEHNVVRFDHMVTALSRTYGSPVVETIQSLPQHQQIILCSAVKLFRGKKKDTTVAELNKSYVNICKSALIRPVGTLEFSSMCRVLNDQGLLKVGQAREDKLKRVTLKVDEADITFALQGVRFFRSCLQ
ncbi:cell division control protein 6 homolog B-like isoform X1 [Tripterygium wilfordii]|uniref:cell division control protein 6 homolog B-like isoform X1 n=1 Tax=Tripterygium wilfordii TaxID=458696 RepID=UPI0018F85877|nr:cell division control protein 6 homolog B-like isoform X1 [Tripterygium wilfordii]